MAEVTLSLTKSELVLLAFLIGRLYRLMIEADVARFAVGRQEIGDLLDKLTEADRSLSDDEETERG